MIKIGDYVVTQDKFGDGTLKCNEPVIYSREIITLTWCYDDDSELFALLSICGHIRNRYPKIALELVMPYIPNARQDREVSGRIFTLKYFAKFINSLDFNKVYVLDPHSDVSLALIDRVSVIENYDNRVYVDGSYVTMYPDAGAAKKYPSRNGEEYIIGNKHRNGEGKIDRYELLHFKEGTKSVLIRDDICSYGGTFVEAAKALRSRGVENIVLYVSHCEDNILKGEVLDYVDCVYTTDSICSVKHPKIKIIMNFR